MLKRVLRSTITGLVGLSAAIWASSILFGTCKPDHFGCSSDSRLWVWILFGAGAVLFLSAMIVWWAFVRQFRHYLKEVDEKTLGKRRIQKERLQQEAKRVRHEISIAHEILAQPLPDEPDDLTPAELQHAVAMRLRRFSATYLSKAEDEPVRIVGWILARLMEHNAIDLQWFGGSPVLGTVSINQDQFTQIIAVGAEFVALMTMDGETVVGEAVEAEDMVSVLREAGLPVWEELLRGRNGNRARIDLAASRPQTA